MLRTTAFLLFFALMPLCLLAAGCLATDDSGDHSHSTQEDADNEFDSSIPTPDQGSEDEVDASADPAPVCGGQDQPCCDGSSCFGDLVCQDGYCTPPSCGDQDEPCCAGSSCNGDLVCQDGYCVPPPCGDLDEPCCAGSSCNGDLECQDGFCAVASGCPDEPACIVPPSATCSNIPVATQTGLPPTLAGGTISNQTYKLSRIDFYADATFNTLVVSSYSIVNNGNSCGSLEFSGPEWGFTALLNLDLNLETIVGPFAQAIVQELYAAGCWTVEGNRLVSDITQCSFWVEGADPPDGLDFETGNQSIKFLLILTKETILASVAEEDRWAAEMAIAGDLPVLFTFQAMQ
ncbi:MAG: hypothetical protein JW797_07930 [Bradymonadales bacterium]|nr:hypothetical protein [Bradymonadales bacterium]